MCTLSSSVLVFCPSHFLICVFSSHFDYTLKLYKDRIRAELNRHLKVEFDKRTSYELTQAVPPTETLNSDPAKERAGLARQGSLAERQPPAALVQKRQQMNNDFPTANDIPVVQVSHKIQTNL